MTLSRPLSDENSKVISVRLARDHEEIMAAQRLRYEMFYAAQNIPAPDEVALTQRDFDDYDTICDHLIAIEKNLQTGERRVVGNYRLLKGKDAARKKGFKTALEYDLTPLQYYSGNILELSRACVHPDYRASGIIQRLWAGIASYIIENKIDLMIGTASFPGTRLGDIKNALAYLHHNHAATNLWAPKALPEQYVDMNMVPAKKLDRLTALREMPPLIKGYLRLGGIFADGAVIDPELQTIDTCVLVETAKIKQRYQKHYIPSQAEQTLAATQPQMNAANRIPA